MSAPAPIDGSITVERLQHNGDREPDIYRIRGAGKDARLVESRTVAILLAHIIGKRPLFEWNRESGMIVRSTREGWLPGELANCARLGSGVGPAIVATDEGATYAYAVQPVLARLLRIWLGEAVAYGEADVARQIVLKRRLGKVGPLIAARNSPGGNRAS